MENTTKPTERALPNSVKILEGIKCPDCGEYSVKRISFSDTEYREACSKDDCLYMYISGLKPPVYKDNKGSPIKINKNKGTPLPDDIDKSLIK